VLELDTPPGRSSPPETAACRCDHEVAGPRLAVDADDCPGGGSLASAPACRAAVCHAIPAEGIETIAVLAGGRERTFRGQAPALFTAAGAFADAIDAHDDRLATTARRDPLAAAREARARADAAGDLVRHTGLLDSSRDAASYDDLLAPTVGLVWSRWRVDPSPPSDGRLDAVHDLESGATARVYGSPQRGTRLYHLEPAWCGFGAETTRTLAGAYDRLASADPGHAAKTPRAAVHAVAGPSQPRIAMTRALRRHTRECGHLGECLADPAVSDVYVTAPAESNPLRVRRDGETLATNVFVTSDGVAALASRFRRESGRGFSRATPTLDAATVLGDRRVRVAGVTDPVSDGQAFAFRAHDRDVWTLPALVANETLTPAAAGLLSVAVERGAAVLVAGPRGSGKTTLLGALLWELPGAVRTVCIEDAPELPVGALQAADRDVQRLRADDDGGGLDPAAALRSALRLGDGALVLGEVRGEEAAVLYEAMRVGANSEAVLGTIHGDGADDVLERVVSDLGVPVSSFATTDLVVTLETVGTGTATRRRVRTIEEVEGTGPVSFAPLFRRDESGLRQAGRLERGNSRFAADCTPPDERYADTLAAVRDRASTVDRLATAGRTDPEAVGDAPRREGR
jgi:type IV secretory pathway ATPase VirB11/archaellum biosynthesis ATPase